MHRTLIFAAAAGATNDTNILTASHLREVHPRTLRRLAIGLVLSLSLHIAVFIVVPKREVIEHASVNGVQGPLVVRLSPPAKTSPPAMVQNTPLPSAPRMHARTPRQPQMMTVPSPTAQSTPAMPEPRAPVRTTDAAPLDFMSSVNANRERRAAAEAAAGGRGHAPTADDIAMANINRNAQSLTPRDGTNGVFQILSKGHREAQFSFRGWTNDSSNSRREVIDVDAGLNGNIELAIIRRMITLIRGHYQGNFNWDSRRLGRVVVLSASIEDTAGLEEFMLREFF